MEMEPRELHNQTEEEKKNRIFGKDYIIVIGGFLAVAIAVASFYYLDDNLFQSSSVAPTEAEIAQHGRILNEAWGANGEESTDEALIAFIEKLDRQIADPTLHPTTKKLLQLRKALTLGSLYAYPGNLEEAASILTEVYESEVALEVDSLYKHAVIPIFLHLAIITEYSPVVLEHLPDAYMRGYEQLVADGVGENEAALLTLLRYARGELPNEYANDAYTLTARMFIAATYLHSFGDNAPKSEQVWGWLEADASRYSEREPTLLIGLGYEDIYPAAYGAYALDILSSYGNEELTSTEQEIINQRYEFALSLIRNSSGDGIFLHSTEALVTLYYLSSLHRRGELGSLDQNEREALAASVVEAASYSRETRVFMGTFWERGKTTRGSWVAARNDMYEMASDYPELESFLEELPSR